MTLQRNNDDAFPTARPAESAWDVPVDKILDELRDAASRDEVRQIAARCIVWLTHRDGEVRTWAAEVLESSARPTASEAGELIGLFSALIERAERETATLSAEATSTLADQLYYAATVIGRIPPPMDSADVSDARAVLDRLTALVTQPPEQPDTFASAKRRAQRVAEKLA